jgi:hypothetical protein
MASMDDYEYPYELRSVEMMLEEAKLVFFIHILAFSTM